MSIGPNEYHKAAQRSVAVQLYERSDAFFEFRLFKSDNPAFSDGEQQRDFVWVGDCVNVALWALQTPSAPVRYLRCWLWDSSIFLEKAKIVFAVMNRKPKIELVDLPENLQPKIFNIIHAVR